MSENTNPQEPRQPRNLFEQILFGVQVTNDNIVTLHGRVDAAVRPCDRKDHGGYMNQNRVSNAAFFSRSSRSKEAR